ncbi:DNA-formamidopyrimidine glycosylase [bacterium]|nr:DNA-formamidopyrimidine glycosylase [bacterium]
MPELPEVETTIREMKKEKIPGLKIKDIWTDFPKMIHLMPAKKISKQDAERSIFKIFKKKTENKTIENIWRKGKNIIFDLSDNLTLLLHQKLTGHLLYGVWHLERKEWKSNASGPLRERINSYIHLIFFLDNGKMLALSDPRKFAKVELWRKSDFKESNTYKDLGDDPLKISFEKFKEGLKRRKTPVKKVLMDQNFIAGIGNIYSSEILFEAKIHPLKKASELSRKEIEKLYKAMQKILKEAINVKGESISDYRTLSGKKGGFDKLRKVYRREACSRCGAKIKRIEISGRSAYYCPVCQKM